MLDDGRPVAQTHPRLRQIAAEIRALQIAAFPPEPPASTAKLQQALVLAEEAGEVCRVAVKESQNIRADTRGTWEHELGDVLLVTLGLCALVDVDADACLAAAVDRLRRRATRDENCTILYSVESKAIALCENAVLWQKAQNIDDAWYVSVRSGVCWDTPQRVNAVYAETKPFNPDDLIIATIAHIGLSWQGVQY